MEFESIKELYKYAESVHRQASSKIVPEKIKEVESEEAIKELNKYTTKQYKRRRSKGIDDVDNMKVLKEEVGNTISITIVNKTPLNPPNDSYKRNYDLDEAIEKGEHYEFPIKNRNKEKYTYLQPRPFIQKTEKRLLIGKEHEKVYKEFLKSKGIDVE